MMYINIPPLQIKASNNILKLEKVLGIPIISTIQTDINNYINNINSNSLEKENKVYKLIPAISSTDNLFDVSLELLRGKKKVWDARFYIQEGLPYFKCFDRSYLIWNRGLYSALKWLDLGILKAEIGDLKFFNKLELSSQEILIFLSNKDIEVIRNNSDLSRVLEAPSYEEAYTCKAIQQTHRKLSKNSIITTINRYDQFQRKQLSLKTLINFEIYRYLKRLNLHIKFWITIFIKKNYLPQYMKIVKDAVVPI